MSLVVLADDDEAMRMLVSIHLDSLGYQVLEGKNGKEALALCAANAVDFVVTDIAMPQMDGMQLVMEIEKIRPGLPVIAISGGNPASGDLLWTAHQLGVRATLKKPFTREELAEAIEVAFGRRQKE